MCVGMYVCIYVHVCRYVYVCVYTYVGVCTYVRTVRVYMCIYSICACVSLFRACLQRSLDYIVSIQKSDGSWEG